MLGSTRTSRPPLPCRSQKQARRPRLDVTAKFDGGVGDVVRRIPSAASLVVLVA